MNNDTKQGQGTARVGTASGLSLPRRVQLAVVAHIRHTYTDYDSLLKQVPYQAARAMIEQASLNQLAQWRGDDDDEPEEMEEILREVIVIPDDEDGDDADKANSNTFSHRYKGRQASIEIVSKYDIVDAMETRPIDYGIPHAVGSVGESPVSEDDQEVTFLGYGQYLFDRSDQARSKRNGAHRLRAWGEAKDRFRHPLLERPAADFKPLQVLADSDSTRIGRGQHGQLSEVLPHSRRTNGDSVTYLRRLHSIEDSSTLIQPSIVEGDHRFQGNQDRVSARPIEI